ncbi:MAG: dUTP diphosphatase [Candidatus Aminicenantales bacterium]
MELRVRRIQKDARIPSYSHEGDAGLDLFSSVDCVLNVGQIQAIPTGIQVAIPDGFVGLIWDKSGLSLQGLHRLAGVIDAGYRGEVKVVMANLTDKPFVVKKGMKVAQMLIQPVEKVRVIETEQLEETPRGEKGFGSTGKY